MNIRLAEEKDIDSVIKLLTQVLNIHAKIRPDILLVEQQNIQKRN
mgnify:CR=1 FL=1